MIARGPPGSYTALLANETMSAYYQGDRLTVYHKFLVER